MADDLAARAADLEAMRDRIHAELGEVFDLLLAQAADGKTNALVKLAERFQDERDQARREVELLSNQLESERIDTNRRLNRAAENFAAARQRGDNLAAAVSRVVNSPTAPHEQRQGQLLAAAQEYYA